MTQMNWRIVLAARPKGLPTEADFRLEEVPIVQPGEGEILVRTRYLSVDPYMRGRMNEGASYAPGVGLGEVMVGGAVGDVVASRHAGFAEGDVAQVHSGWQDYGLASGDGARKVDPDLAPISTSLGVLGMPGITAWVGLLEIGHPQAGETVVVSGAAGAVGSLVGQIARIKGCRVVGVAGSDVKVSHVTDELGFAAAFNYKTTLDYGAALGELCPDGVDVYFDNVGGTISDAVLQHMNVGGRISVCGQISQYNLRTPEMGPRLTWLFITRRLQMRGFLVFDFEKLYAKALQEMSAWVQDGRLSYREDIVAGLEQTPAAFIGMLTGDNIGKRLVQVA
ncbi:MAG: NADP-dependent oxidoreductase [bacterium]|nr:NADP-dependent oxidoreductase [bacterium]